VENIHDIEKIIRNLSRIKIVFYLNYRYSIELIGSNFFILIFIKMSMHEMRILIHTFGDIYKVYNFLNYNFH